MMTAKVFKMDYTSSQFSLLQLDGMVIERNRTLNRQEYKQIWHRQNRAIPSAYTTRAS